MNILTRYNLSSTALLLFVCMGFIFLNAHHSDVQAIQITDCDTCYESPSAQHYTFNYLRYRCIDCGDTWWSIYSIEPNDSTQCFQYFSSSYMSSRCPDCTTCSECGKKGSETHYDIEKDVDSCSLESHHACEGDRTVETSRSANSSSSCYVRITKGTYECPVCSFYNDYD